MNIMSLKHINERTEENADIFIKECEKSYNNQILKIADGIKDDYKSRPVILLSGPSGSGKTTTALKLEAILDSLGLETHMISMDNYFTPLKLEAGADLESPERMDIELLQSHIVKIANCEEVRIPLFNFKTQSIGGYRTLKRKRNELIILEGIHALNPEVTGYNSNVTQRIFVNVEKSVNSDGGMTLDPPKIRLIRRLVRDFYYRGRSFSDTINNFERVENGSRSYVIPYKNRADFLIDSFIPYEICAFKNIVLKGFKDNREENHLSQSICGFLQKSADLNEDYIPKDSILREFIGGSIFSY